VNYLSPMVLFIRVFVLILPNRMELLKEYIDIILNILILFYCMLKFFVKYRVKLFLLLFKLIIKFHLLLSQVCFTFKSYMDIGRPRKCVCLRIDAVSFEIKTLDES